MAELSKADRTRLDVVAAALKVVGMSGASALEANDADDALDLATVRHYAALVAEMDARDAASQTDDV